MDQLTKAIYDTLAIGPVLSPETMVQKAEQIATVLRDLGLVAERGAPSK